MKKVTMSDEIDEFYKRLSINNTDTSRKINGFNLLNSIKTTLDCKMPTAFKLNEVYRFK